MNYRDVYFSRINHLGTTTGERIRNSGIRTFERWLNDSPQTVRNLSVDRGLYFDGIILTNKDKVSQKIMYLNVSLDIPLVLGDLLNWKQEDGTVEKWILIQKEKIANPMYQVFWMIRCNYLVKWIDANGHYQESWAHFTSSLDDKIKGNFRTWHSLISPQPNKFAEIIMPRRNIERSTNIIVDEESWSLIEYDHSSVQGVMYLSLIEGKVNTIYDDIDNSLADTDKLAKYEILKSTETQSFVVGEVIQPSFTLTKNGQVCNLEVNLLPVKKSIAKLVDGVLTAVGIGETEIIIQLKDFPEITNTINIVVGEDKSVGKYIQGNSTLKLDNKSEYKLMEVPDGATVIYSLNNDLAKIISVSAGVATVRANDKNKLGTIILTATYDGVDYTKEINITPLW